MPSLASRLFKDLRSKLGSKSKKGLGKKRGETGPLSERYYDRPSEPGDPPKFPLPDETPTRYRGKKKGK